MEMEVDDHILICVRMGLRQNWLWQSGFLCDRFLTFLKFEDLASSGYSASEHRSQVVLSERTG